MSHTGWGTGQKRDQSKIFSITENYEKEYLFSKHLEPMQFKTSLASWIQCLTWKPLRIQNSSFLVNVVTSVPELSLELKKEEIGNLISNFKVFSQGNGAHPLLNNNTFDFFHVLLWFSLSSQYHELKVYLISPHSKMANMHSERNCWWQTSNLSV